MSSPSASPAISGSAVSSSVKRFPIVRELDGIRAIAVTIVFLSHVGLGRYIPGGLGVTIFFFLSGYLITSLLRVEAANTGQVNYLQFYIRRTLRIMPPLYLTLFVIWVTIATGVLARPLDYTSILAQILLVTNYGKFWDLGPGLPGPPLWSLAVEEHFYLAYPWLFGAILMHLPRKNGSLFGLALCLVPLAFRLVHGLNGGLELNYFLSHTRMDSILFGCVLALWHNPLLDDDAWKPNIVHLILGAAMVLGAALVRDPFFGDTVRYTVQGLGLIVIFSWLLGTQTIANTLLKLPPLQMIGRYSYSLYLIHGFFIVMLRTIAPAMPLWAIGVATAGLSICYAAVMYQTVEKPLAALRRRLHDRRSSRDFRPQTSDTPATT